MRDRYLTHNPKRIEMAARHLDAPPGGRGTTVRVVPDRGEPFMGLLVDTIVTMHYGTWYDVLGQGRLGRYDADRVSGLKG